MSGLTDYAETELLDHVDGKTSYTKPTAMYSALLTDDPTDAGSQTDEVAASGYARQSITADMAAAHATTGNTTNSGAITHGPAGASWGTITDAAFPDASTSGNYLMYGTLTSSRTIANGDSFQFAVSQISLTLG
jgi:hypothetical protein